MIKTSPEFYKSAKIMDLKTLRQKVQELQLQGKKVGICSGSFDLIHAGHLIHLASAKSKCDALIVSIASDTYNMTKTKTKGRPIFSEQVRAYCVSQLEAVDFVTFNDGTDEPVIRAVRPDIYIKGSDYAVNQPQSMLNLFEELKKLGITWEFTKDEKLSTSDIISYIKTEVE